MNKYEIKLVLDVFYDIEAENEDSAIEKAMDYYADELCCLCKKSTLIMGSIMEE